MTPEEKFQEIPTNIPDPGKGDPGDNRGLPSGGEREEMTQMRCPVCNGCGAVEAWFGTGCLPETMQGLKEKQCPACLGTGIQIIFDVSLSPPPSRGVRHGYPPTTTGGNL